MQKLKSYGKIYSGGDTGGKYTKRSDGISGDHAGDRRHYALEERARRVIGEDGYGILCFAFQNPDKSMERVM